MTKKLLMMLGVIGFAGMLAVAPAQAGWGNDDASGGGGGGDMGEMMGALGLDDAQWGKFNALRRSYRINTIKMQAGIDVAEVELEALADSSDVNVTALSKKVREIADRNADLRIFRYKTLSDMRSFISGEQFDTFRWMAMKMGFNFGDDDKKGGHGH